MADDNDTSDTLKRLDALEMQVAHLECMVRSLTAAVLDTAQSTGYRRKHIKLAQDGIRLGYVNPNQFD